MAQVRALTTLCHENIMYKAGDVFEYADELAKQLKGDVTDGMELVTKKTTAVFVKAQADAQKALDDTAAALRAAYEMVKAELEADPTRGDLVQRVLDAETAAHEAEQAASANSNHDLT